MAKQFRWERAWQHFTNEFQGIRSRRGHSGYSPKRWRREQRASQEAYWVLIREAKALGINVYLQADLGTSRDFYGEEFRVGGTWSSWEEKIRLTHRSFHTLAHEFAHALDEILGGRMVRPDCEFVACGAGYLLVCQVAGIITPKYDVVYAKRQGATERTLEICGERTLQMFREMASLVNVQIG